MSNLPGPWETRPPATQPKRKVRRISGWGLLGVIAAIGLLVLGLVKLTPYQSLSGDEWVNVSRGALLLLVVCMGLTSRRIDLKQTLRHGLIWAAIVAVLLVGFSFRD